MKKIVNDLNEQCPECDIVGMTCARIDRIPAMFVGHIKAIPRHYHECENCGKNFRVQGERIMNLHVRNIFLRYFQKFEEL